jgi:hypothetical protein
MKAPETSWLRENQFRSEEERISRGKQFIIRSRDSLKKDTSFKQIGQGLYKKLLGHWSRLPGRKEGNSIE